MKTMISSWRHRYVRTFSILLIAVVLIAGVASCTTPVAEYDLTMAVNPPGSGTATDLTGTSPYAEAAVVNITATAAPCYRFVNWSAPAGAFGDPNAATTTFTMPARDVTVTANFELVPADHFKFYRVSEASAPYIGKEVELVDQFGAFNATVGQAVSFGNPVEKIHGSVVSPIEDVNRHYTLYLLEGEFQRQSWEVVINNQFQDDVKLVVQGPMALAVPTEKIEADLGAPECLNHYLVYVIEETSLPEVGVHLKDQFIEEDVMVEEPILFGNPVKKTVVGSTEVSDIQNPDEHLVFYGINLPTGNMPIEKTIQIDNQFGPQTLDLTLRDLLAVPSQKISWEQPLDHFKCYTAVGLGTAPLVEVQLEDQFGTITATVGQAVAFANPVEKWHGEVITPISNPNNHLTFYELAYGATPPSFWVQVTNQFGVAQELWVTGPYYLAVPTKKGLQDPPEGLDHFLVYHVTDSGTLPPATVGLQDQWTSVETEVGAPAMFANPVKKTHGSVVTPIKHPDRHLVFYAINGGTFVAEELPIANQFGPQFLNVWAPQSDFLAVPSLKLEWSALS